MANYYPRQCRTKRTKHQAVKAQRRNPNLKMLKRQVPHRNKAVIFTTKRLSTRSRPIHEIRANQVQVAHKVVITLLLLSRVVLSGEKCLLRLLGTVSKLIHIRTNWLVNFCRKSNSRVCKPSNSISNSSQSQETLSFNHTWCLRRGHL